MAGCWQSLAFETVARTVTVFDVQPDSDRFVLEGPFGSHVAFDGASLLVPEPSEMRVGIYDLGHRARNGSAGDARVRTRVCCA